MIIRHNLYVRFCDQFFIELFPIHDICILTLKTSMELMMGNKNVLLQV